MVANPAFTIGIEEEYQIIDPDTGELKKGSQALWLRDRDEVERQIAAWSRPWRVSSSRSS